MKYLIAIDSFKDSISSLEGSKAIANGIYNADKNAEVAISPMADGGEGSVEALLSSNKGKKIPVSVSSPLMGSVQAHYAVFYIDGESFAFIECAESTGLSLVPSHLRNPMNTNSFGLGEQMKHAILSGYRNIIITLGGSATNDAGIGMLQALGWIFYDQSGNVISKDGNPLLHVADFCHKNSLPELKECNITVATDVTNPFFGPNGAACIFSKQKGATEDQIDILDEAMERFSLVINKKLGKNVQVIRGSGAAGGLGGALVSFLDANIASGVELLIELTNLEEKVKWADVVITGEGSLDQQSMMGKVPIGVAKLAKKYNKTVIGIAGRIDTDLEAVNEWIDAVFCIQTECRVLEEALSKHITTRQLQVTAEQVARLVRRITS